MNQLREFDRTEAVRQRRIKACFEADRPDSAEVLRAIRCWNQVQSRPRPLLSLRAAWVIAAAMMLSGGALAASSVLKFPAWSVFTHSAQPQPTAKPPAVSRSSHYVVERGGGRTEYVEPSKLTLLPGEHAALIVDNARTELVGPGVAQVQAAPQATRWITRFEPQVWVPELEVRESLPSTANSASAVAKQKIEPLGNVKPISQSNQVQPGAEIMPVRHADAAAPTAKNTVIQRQLDGAWARAAAAMRNGDDVGAAAALNEISKSTDPAARDAALLTQAQLDLAAGRRASALPVLKQLSQTGATAFVRQRAGEILVNGN